jgi:hypothetical protein
MSGSLPFLRCLVLCVAWCLFGLNAHAGSETPSSPAQPLLIDKPPELGVEEAPADDVSNEDWNRVKPATQSGAPTPALEDPLSNTSSEPVSHPTEQPEECHGPFCPGGIQLFNLLHIKLRAQN